MGSCGEKRTGEDVSDQRRRGRRSPLTFGVQAAAEARAEVVRFCAAARYDGAVLDDARLVASELATNAVLHGQPPIGITVSADSDVLTIEVMDASAAPVRAGSADDESGRGLAIVGAVATTWESKAVPGNGKKVIAHLRLQS